MHFQILHRIFWELFKNYLRLYSVSSMERQNENDITKGREQSLSYHNINLYASLRQLRNDTGTFLNFKEES